MAGIRDVARRSGLAVATVSRYLNGQIQLSPATKHRLEAAVQKLNYTPNAIARRLSSGSSETLGLMVTDISYPFLLRSRALLSKRLPHKGMSLPSSTPVTTWLMS